MSSRHLILEKLKRYDAYLGVGNMKQAGNLVGEILRDIVSLVAPTNGIDHSQMPLEPELEKAPFNAAEFYKGETCEPCNPENPENIFKQVYPELAAKMAARPEAFDSADTPVGRDLGEGYRDRVLPDHLKERVNGYKTVQRPAGMKVIKRTAMPEPDANDGLLEEAAKPKRGRKPKAETTPTQAPAKRGRKPKPKN